MSKQAFSKVRAGLNPEFVRKYADGIASIHARDEDALCCSESGDGPSSITGKIDEFNYPLKGISDFLMHTPFLHECSLPLINLYGPLSNICISALKTRS